MHAGKTPRDTRSVPDRAARTESGGQAESLIHGSGRLVAQRRRLASSFGPDIVQRMVIYTDDVGKVDKIIAADIAKQFLFAKGPLVSLKDLEAAEQDAIAIQPGDAVVISGHGSPGKIQDLTAEQIATLLSKIKNIQQARVIFLSACNTSTDEPDKSDSSVVDVTHETLGKMVQVVGSPGVKINDHTKVTGDGLTYYLPATSSAASDIEAFVTHYTRQHDVGQEQGFVSLEQALARGNELLKDQDFLGFYDTLLKVLGNFDRPLIEKLLQEGQVVLGLGAQSPSDTWPAWLQGWFGLYSCSAGVFLKWAQGRLDTACAMLQRLLTENGLSLIARPDQGQSPLTGKPKGGGEKTGVPFDGEVNI